MTVIEQGPVVNVAGLNRHFGRKQVLRNIDFQVEQGTVSGLVGENGAGKTTLIKHLLGLLRAQNGKVNVFGLNPVAQPQRVLSRIGYLSEEPDLPAWMTISEYLDYSSAFYVNWDKDLAATLLKRFDLSAKQKIGDLSKGQRARTALTAAQAHRPDLLLLDEPSSGLDPIVRRDILDSIIANVADEGRTVLFSSHLLEEVERVCDRITMISAGETVMSGPLDEVMETHYHVAVDGGSEALWRSMDEVLSFKVSRRKTEWELKCRGTWPNLEQTLSEITVLNHRAMSIDEIFVAHSGRHIAEAAVGE